MESWILNNWYYIVALFLLIIIGIYGVMEGKVKEWLKYAVSVAEEDLGSGTGQLKLRRVYDMFVAKYPKFSVIVPFPIFSSWVDIALEWMKIQLENNKDFKAVITGEYYES